MNLENMLEKLGEKCGDYKRTNEEILKSLEIPHTKLLIEYMTQIQNDPLLWFDAFPMEYSSVQSMAKPKSGILYLLEKNQDVRDDLGYEFCNKLSDTIHTTWKTNKTMLVEKRISKENRKENINVDADMIKLQEENKKLKEEIELLNSNRKLEQEKKDEKHREEITSLISTCKLEQEKKDEKHREEITSLISTCKLEQEKKDEKLEKLNLDKISLLSNVEDIKDMFIDILQANGVSEININLYKKLLSKW